MEFPSRTRAAGIAAGPRLVAEVDGEERLTAQEDREESRHLGVYGLGALTQ